MKNQQSLTTHFNFTKAPTRSDMHESSSDCNTPISADLEVQIQQESVEVEIPPVVEAQQETVEEDGDVEDSNVEDGNVEDSNVKDGDVETMDWEDELHAETDAGNLPNIQGWDKLRQQIEADLKKSEKTLPVSQLTKMIIVRNFATLRLKGYGRIEASKQIAQQWHKADGTHFARQIRKLARHYQVFEQLPREKRGGARSGRTMLLDERIRNATSEWLKAQRAGEVTPKRLQDALNNTILPGLSVSLKQPLSTRTARRWLLRLGWRLTTLRKGVYMDGHERPDVVEYREKVFLPAMERFER
jgi:hypothetical protein